MYAAPCDRTDDTVHHQRVRLLEVLHDLLRLRSENPIDVVGSQDLHTGEDPLKSLHVVPGVAQLDDRWHVDSSVVLLPRVRSLLDELLPGQPADDGVSGEMGRCLEG